MAARDENRRGVFARFLGRRDGARADVSEAPTTERGYQRGDSAFWVMDDDEKVPELVWPLNIKVYDEMRRQDAQVISVLRAVKLPIQRTPWRIDPNGAPQEVVDFVAANLGLPVKGVVAESMPRRRDRFSWSDHLHHALTSLDFGHAYFEQVYRIQRDAFGIPRAYIRKLGWRPPATISKVDVAADGGLVAIEQGMLGASNHRMEVARLVAYANEREGGNWLGRSMLRPAYKYWLLKDRMLRVQAQTIDRNGMGIPVVSAPKLPDNLLDAAEYKRYVKELVAEGLKVARNLRSGRSAGASVANGGDVKLIGVEGTLPDADKPIRYYDEQIARAVLAHFLNLGGDNSTGSYALGDTFADFFTMALQTVALSIADVANQHIVEDLVDINFGPEVTAPLIVFDEIGRSLTSTALRELIDSGAIEPDETLETFIRRANGLPAKDAATARPRSNLTPSPKEAA